MSDDDPNPGQAHDIGQAEQSVEPLAAIPLNFCTSCGAPWEAQWIDCPHCAGRRQRQAVAGESYTSGMQSIKSAIALYFSMLAVSIFAIIAALAGGKEPGAIATMVATGAITLVSIGWSAANWNTLWPMIRQPVAIGWLGGAALAAVPTFLLASVAVRLIQFLGVPDLDYTAIFTDDGFGLTWVIAVVCVQPAIFEELAFRGVIQSSLLRVTGSTESIIASAMMFGILHLSIPSMPHLVLMGIVLAWLRMRTGSLLPGMIMHFSHNLLVILAEQMKGNWPW